ncbi:MAG: ATP-dependent DNA helicase [Saprospiraceae bacterium]
MTLNVMGKLKAFETECQKLNEEQFEAVNALEGPVMVLAGPGTGKTQILAMRIANLLYQAVCDPESILCLTYTEAGATAMRKRLMDLIGSESRKVNIHTFHSFCNRVISEFPDVFRTDEEFQIADILEERELLEDLLRGIAPPNNLYRIDSNYQYILKPASSLFETIKKELIDPDVLKKDLLRHINDMRLEDKYYYKRATNGKKVGDFRNAKYETDIEKYNITLSAIDLYPEYCRKLRERKRLDFNDLINEVILKLQESEEFLLTLQEKYQYVLVDEFQDTNGSQLKILDLLISYWEQPNIFVVGDADQAIYRFQGANVRNMTEFNAKYNPFKIQLAKNYRSIQGILDASEQYISNNVERLGTRHGPLIAASGPNIRKPLLVKYNAIIEEVKDICDQIENLVKNENIKPDKIAVLFRKNKEAEEYAKGLMSRDINVSISKEVNVLQHPIIQNILNILKYISTEFTMPRMNEWLLYEILHAPFIQIDTGDIGRIACFLRIERGKNAPENDPHVKYLTDVLSNPDDLQNAGIEDIASCLDFSDKLDCLIREKSLYTLSGLFQKILYDFNVINYLVVKNQDFETLEVVNSFYEYLNNLSARNPGLNFVQLSDTIDKMNRYKIVVPLSRSLARESGVRLSTIHSAKGLEYQYVFMPNNTESKRSGGNSFALPPGYSFQDEENSEEDERRLHYVGLTRAENFLQVSYSEIKEDGKSLKPNQLVLKLEEEGKTEIVSKVTTQDTARFAIMEKLQIYNKGLALIPDILLKGFLEKFRLSATTMSDYLRCPVSFYYNHVLKVPSPKNKYFGFGIAVHSTLEKYLENYPQTEIIYENELKEIYEYYLSALRWQFTEDEFINYKNDGLKHLKEFIKYYAKDWGDLSTSEFEVQFHEGNYFEIPITGKLDRLDKKSEQYIIIDYKTGKSNDNAKFNRPKNESDLGGEYWRQMTFYSILCQSKEQYANQIQGGIFYFVIPDKTGKFSSKILDITKEDQEIVGRMITKCYSDIVQAKFDQGCGEESCRWCNYLNITKKSDSDETFIDQDDAE